MKRKLLILCFSFALSAVIAQQYRTIKDLSYVSAEEPSTYRREICKLDLYYPEGKQGFKTLVWFHGGGLETGRKEIPHALQGKGFAVVGVDYRLYPKCKNPEYTDDAAAAVAWVYHHIGEYGGNPREVYVSGHSAGGYLTSMLCLAKGYLSRYGVDADSIRGYFPIAGQCATHYTIRKERQIPFDLPIIDQYAPLNNARKLGTKLVLITGDRHLEQMARYEENLYLKAVLEGVGNKEVPLYELEGFSHGGVAEPGCLLVSRWLK